MNSPIFLKFDSATTILTIIAVAVITAILFSIFYSIAIAPKPLVFPLPPVNNYTVKIPDGITFKLVHKNGWHRCVEDPGVLCKGPYTVKETIQRYQNLTPPAPFSAPLLPPP